VVVVLLVFVGPVVVRVAEFRFLMTIRSRGFAGPSVVVDRDSIGVLWDALH